MRSTDILKWKYLKGTYSIEYAYMNMPLFNWFNIVSVLDHILQDKLFIYWVLSNGLVRENLLEIPNSYKDSVYHILIKKYPVVFLSTKCTYLAQTRYKLKNN